MRSRRGHHRAARSRGGHHRAARSPGGRHHAVRNPGDHHRLPRSHDDRRRAHQTHADHHHAARNRGGRHHAVRSCGGRYRGRWGRPCWSRRRGGRRRSPCGGGGSGCRRCCSGGRPDPWAHVDLGSPQRLSTRGGRLAARSITGFVLAAGTAGGGAARFSAGAPGEITERRAAADTSLVNWLPPVGAAHSNTTTDRRWVSSSGRFTRTPRPVAGGRRAPSRGRASCVCRGAGLR